MHIGCYLLTVVVHTDSQGGAPTDGTHLWWLTIVYGPQDEGQKSLFLEELATVRDQCPRPWVVIGDFNLILDEADKNNSRINHRTMRKFRQTVAELQLLDIHLHVRRYTWSNERDDPTLVRIDGALASLD
jgi:exonuclease III